MRGWEGERRRLEASGRRQVAGGRRQAGGSQHPAIDDGAGDLESQFLITIYS